MGGWDKGTRDHAQTHSTTAHRTQRARQAKKLCEDDLYTQQRGPLQAWYSDRLYPFLASVLHNDALRTGRGKKKEKNRTASAPTPGSNLHAPSSILAPQTAFDDRLRMLLMEALAYARVKDLFDIIVEFPDSMQAVVDLKEW